MKINWTDVMKENPANDQICIVIGGKRPGEREALCMARYVNPEQGFVTMYKTKFFQGIIIKRTPHVKYLRQSRFFHVSLWAKIEEFAPYLEYTFQLIPGMLSNIHQETMSNKKYRELVQVTYNKDPNTRRAIKNYYVGDDSAMYPQKIVEYEVSLYCNFCRIELSDGDIYFQGEENEVLCNKCIAFVEIVG